MFIKTALTILLFAGTVLGVVPGSQKAGAAGYDPLGIGATPASEELAIVVGDVTRDRAIPLRVFLPPGNDQSPVILFSHGLGGSPEHYAYLARHWSARGYVAVFLQHPGSDISVWKDLPPAARMAALEKAASLPNFLLRAKDVSAVIDQLARWNTASGHRLAGRMDMNRVGMAGHSFGAITTQAVAGQSFPLVSRTLTDPRIRAAVAMSPSARRTTPEDPSNPFSPVTIPWLLMTGTEDHFPFAIDASSSRFAVFPALPPGGKYEVVFYRAEHSVFTDRALPGDREARNPNHHRAILALTSAFWDAWLRNDQAALQWLDDAGPRSVLEEKDRWQRK